MKITLKKDEIKLVLDKIIEKLTNEGTDCFMFVKNRRNEKKDYKFTNAYCLEELQYDYEDVMSEIMDLKESNYYESVFDRGSKKADLLHIFIKEIINKQVYIKIKIKEIGESDIVLCVSFHFVEHQIGKLPYG